jgi:hypothetical protein
MLGVGFLDTWHYGGKELAGANNSDSNQWRRQTMRRWWLIRGSQLEFWWKFWWRWSDLIG